MELSEVFVKFLNQFILALIPIVTPFLVAYISQQIRYLQAKIKSENAKLYDSVSEVVRIAVYAAEAAGLKEYTDDKLAYAVDFVKRELGKRGFSNLDVDSIVDLIEAELAQGLNAEKYK